MNEEAERLFCFYPTMKILINGYRAKKNKKILYGGPRNFTGLLIQHFNSLSHRVVSLSIHGKKKIDGKFLLKQEAKGKNPAWFLKLRLNFADIFKAKSAAYPQSLLPSREIIRQAIRRIDPDVVLLNGYSIVNWYILRAAKDLGLPVVMAHHGLWFKEMNTADNNMSRATEKMLREMEKDITRFADCEVFLNEYSRNEYSRKLIKVRSGRHQIIPLPYNPLFKTKPKEVLRLKAVPKGKVKIGMVSRWDPVKSPQKFMALAKEAKKQKLPWEFYAVIKLKYNYKEIGRFKKDFSKYINVIPQLPQETLKGFYRQMDVLVLPSRFDTSPTVVMEAALQGKPTVISPTVGWVSEYKRFGAGDWVISFDNPSRAVKKIAALIGNNRDSFTRFAKHIEIKHSPKNVFAAYDKLLRKLVK